MVFRDEAQARRGRLGGLALASKQDPRVYTAPGRIAFLTRFLDAQPSDLPEAERLRRAEAALRLYMTRLALRSVAVRQRKKAQRQRRAAVP